MTGASRIFITGSSDGLGRLAAAALSKQGHEVVLHARNESRAEDARANVPGNAGVVIGDLSSIVAIRDVAKQANSLGPFEVVIHNAGLYAASGRRVETEDGLTDTFAVNVVAPYLLTALIAPPRRQVYLSSGMHLNGHPSLDDAQWEKPRWSGSQAYSDSKLYVTAMTMALAARWPNTLSNAVDPGWVPTRMGGAGASDDLEMGWQTQGWLAASDDAGAQVSGEYWHHRQIREPHPATRSREFQQQLLEYCAEITAAELPSG